MTDRINAHGGHKLKKKIPAILTAFILMGVIFGAVGWILMLAHTNESSLAILDASAAMAAISVACFIVSFALSLKVKGNADKQIFKFVLTAFILSLIALTFIACWTAAWTSNINPILTNVPFFVSFYTLAVVASAILGTLAAIIIIKTTYKLKVSVDRSEGIVAK